MFGYSMELGHNNIKKTLKLFNAQTLCTNQKTCMNWSLTWCYDKNKIKLDPIKRSKTQLWYRSIPEIIQTSCEHSKFINYVKTLSFN